MSGFIILGVLAIVWFVTAANSTSRKANGGQERKAFGENFPFPDFSDDSMVRADPRVVDQSDCAEQAIAEQVDESEGMPSTGRPIAEVQHLEEPKRGERNAAIRDFDIRRAVIYSEILKPKFKEL
ncbi:MAG: hypothetical protein RR752_02655 [Mucinivorans sp.]